MHAIVLREVAWQFRQGCLLVPYRVPMLSTPHATDPAMTPRTSSQALRPRAGTVAIIWLGVALVFVAENMAAGILRNEPTRWLSAFWFELEYWFIFFLCTPFFFYMARRFRFDEGMRGRSLAAHAAGGSLFALLQPLCADALQWTTAVLVLPPADPRLARLAGSVVRGEPILAITALWKYAVIIGVYYAFDYHRKYRDHQLRAAQLEGQLATAQLQALKMQLHPHFLFNALNSASMLTLTEPARAHHVLVRLADLLRTTLRSSSELEVTLAEELDFLDRYLDIEKVRFEDRLTVQFEIAEDAEEVPVPSLILQPLVENAIHHGFAPDSSAHCIVVRAALRGSHLLLEVEDDGAGLPPGWSFERGAGTGLSNVQARLSAAYGHPHPLELTRGARGGLLVRLTLPSRRAAVAEVA